MKSNKPGNIGPKPTYTPAPIKQLVGATPVEQRSTYRDMAAATGLTLGTLSRHLKKGTLQRRSSRIKPLLTEANKTERLAFCPKALNSTTVRHLSSFDRTSLSQASGAVAAAHGVTPKDVQW
ncbi:hypothetical protein H257_04890 [Aphanomyces astaci]|uniref:Transposase Tc1-like domain-containing protein n=1 Tax=Aphanomyces astaci TaxID=112090 RepID=W4GTG6_APHAT|nr:hypothetical protein H257_04890 [Aphanomyces astaci]ETV82178.1 hypothetical protein H257_04890 [Aphanomyces astaci]|eukprot:XP_009827847.1 hypothetical protein H257_04890 [Aphanomyces astaci]